MNETQGLLMTAVTFDTYAFIKRLKESGFNETQAEALAEAIKGSQAAHLDTLATKHDLKELELKIDNRLESVKGELALLKWMIGVLLAGVVSLVLKAFFIS
ncbi:MAG: coiled-coil domain-containing protein [Candidatus Binatia bacterium]